MSQEILQLSDTHFDAEVLQSGKTVVVDFWAQWCGPCKMMLPMLEEAAQEYAGEVLIGKLDVDANPATMARFNVRSLPTIIMFKDGSECGRSIGAVSKTRFADFIERHL